jgi:type I restriction enzyme S subunit
VSFPRYPKYKASGVEWLGEVPEHWEVKRLKHVAANIPFAIVDGPFGTQLKADDYRETGVPLVRISNLSYEGQFSADDLVFIDERKALEVERSTVLKGDIVIGKTGATIGKTALFNSFERGIIASSCLKITPNKSKLTSRFLLSVIVSGSFQKNLVNESGGSTRDTINITPFGNLPIALPPLPEQTAIADFLDRETGKIDALVAEQRRLMELLKEKRQAVISHAVTRGLNPAAPLKDSGIDWLGPVPAHWEVMTLRRCTRCVQTGGTPSSEPPSADLEEGVVWFTPGDFGDALRLTTSTRKISHAVVRSGEVKIFPAKSVLVVSIGATLGKVGFTEEASSANQQINAVIPNERIDGYFLAYSLLVKAEVMRFLSNASTIGIMNQEKTKDIWLAVPPVEEQAVVTAFLDTELAKFDTLTAEALRAIDLLQERRTALISAAVTGQIDVRAIASSS